MTVRCRCLAYRVKAQVPSSHSTPRGYSTLPKVQDGIPVFRGADGGTEEERAPLGGVLDFG